MVSVGGGCVTAIKCIFINMIASFKSPLSVMNKLMIQPTCSS